MKITLESILPKEKERVLVDGSFVVANSIYNIARQDCLTALQSSQAKGELIVVREGEKWVKLPTEDELVNTIKENSQYYKNFMSDVVSYSVLSEGNISINKLAQAILELLTKGGV